VALFAHDGLEGSSDVATLLAAALILALGGGVYASALLRPNIGTFGALAALSVATVGLVVAIGEWSPFSAVSVVLALVAVAGSVLPVLKRRSPN
jgi:hypothetical protein